MTVSPNKNIIDQIIEFSIKNESFIRHEFQKMADHYTKNPEDLIDVVVDIKHDAKNDDFYSDIIKDAAEKTLDNIGNNTWKFDENMWLTSLDKVNKQFRKIPNEVLLTNKDIKVMFYDLAPEPDKFGIHLVLSRVIVDWRNFQAMYLAKNN